ncbi:unnamed protein product (macronuclear) [Paramecium tetraurelia]|uniref:non-specific serine/threonine protein kinase n=1 Tax=Paramecium tetraurelia TaxID=5888 RepID=A0D6T6_PARTE|nr:uncharacterized protein GSPATT00001794001 [Paramecium tetraurelia]CAK78753.1 unnamed protein product [Paramecium tetraurelia]|eukprot:XP_001446150.1 hypothetical protein (macronuclear) [Paramecium tetraurelia strain d4-2]
MIKKQISSIQQVVKTGTQIVEYSWFQHHQVFSEPPISNWKQTIMDNFEWFLILMVLVYCVTFIFMYKNFSQKSHKIIVNVRKESATSDELQNSVRLGTEQNEKQKKDQTSSTESSPRNIQNKPKNNTLVLTDQAFNLKGNKVSESREKIISWERHQEENMITQIETKKVRIKASDDHLQFVTSQFGDLNQKNAKGVHMIEQDNGDGKAERIIHILTDWSRYCETGKFQKLYTLPKLIGKGAFGEVYKSQKIIDLKEYAVKRIYFKVQNEKTLRDHPIFREIGSLQEINHKNVVRYYTSWIEELTKDNLADIAKLHKIVDDQKQAKLNEVQNSYQPQLMDDMSSINNYVQFIGGNDADNEQQIQTISKQSKNLVSFHLSDCSSHIQSQMRRYHFNPNQKDEQYQLFTLYIEMELCDYTLRDFIDKVDRKKDYPLIKSIFIQILEGIIYMHTNQYIHRDLKPQNIFINSKNEVKIGDLGLCNSLIIKMDDEFTSSSGEYTNNVGTPLYMAPEVKDDLYGSAADIYPLGIILFEMLWEIKTHYEKNRLIQSLTKDSILPPDLFKNHPVEAELILKMVSKNPNKRPTAQQVLDSLNKQ